MSNRNRTMKKKNRLTGRNLGFLTAIALSAVLVGGQFPAEIVTAYSSELTESRASVFPDNITVDEPTALANVLLPANDYGTLAWADGSYVPQKRVQSCEVILTPAEGVDLSAEEGWDEETGTVSGYVHVVVTSIADDKIEVLPEENEETSNEEIDMEDTENKEQQEKETLSDPAKEETENEDVKEETKKEETENTASNEDDLGDKMPDETTGKDETDKDDTSKDDTNDLNTDNITTDTTIEDDKDLTETEPADKETMPDSENTDDNDADNNTDNDNSDQDDNVDNKEDTVVQDPENTDEEDSSNNIFDNPISPDEKDERPSDADENLSDEEKEARAQMNHTCDGITVSGVNLPWYVQFRVSSGDSYQFTNESDAMIFQSYEFELWDLKNNTEYEIPSGEYISVTVPVKAGYEYTIEHLLDNGAMETIIPSVDGDTMVFSTHSFSPFGIAGSKQLVGPETGSDTGSDDTTVTEPSIDTDVQVTPGAISMDQTVDKNEDIQDPTTSEQETNTDRADAVKTNDTKTDQESDAATPDTSAAKTEGAVNTGDTTTILPFVIVLVIAAAVIIGAAVFMKKRKK